MCARVLAPSLTPALTQKYVSTRSNKFQLGLQFVTKQSVKRLLEHTVLSVPSLFHSARSPVLPTKHSILHNGIS
jgi:hypothetical protein